MKTTINQILPTFFTVIFLAFTANAQTSKRCSSGSSQITEIEKHQILMLTIKFAPNSNYLNFSGIAN